jgi:tRNA (cmo5U34)-methyltransferase
MAQFHFDPDTYLEMVRSEVVDYDTLQDEVERATRAFAEAGALRTLDLGAGTGSTSLAVLRACPTAQLVLVDENPGMLAVAEDALPVANVERVEVADLSDPLPEGPFDLVVSALAIHHLDGPAKQALFAGIHSRLREGGRFVMADVVIPDNAADATTPLTDDYDKPDRARDLLAWLEAAQFRTECVWNAHDLAVFVSDRL